MTRTNPNSAPSSRPSTLSPPSPARPRAPQHPHRFRLSRAGIHQVWQYDDVFTFGDGRLLLRGKNGAGKSKALEMLLPYLLDGDPRRIDSTGSAKTTLRWLMLDGWSGGTNRLGYLWLEFVRTDEDSQHSRLTVGAAIKASTSTGEARPTYFVTPLSAVDDLGLADPSRRPSVDRLRGLVNPENCYDRAVEYRARVARDLFGITDLARYRNLVHLLHGLRRPTIGDRIEAGELVKVLTEALPPLDDDILDEVARNLDDLDTVRDELARLEKTDAALTSFLRSYRGYLRGVLRSRVGLVRGALTELTRCRRAAGDAARDLVEQREAEADHAAAVDELETAREAATVDLRAIHASAAYHALGDLQERRATLEAKAGTARAAWQAADHARANEATAAARLRDEADDIGTELVHLRDQTRDARRTARRTGLDDALLGEPPRSAPSTVAPASTELITDVDGHSCDVHRPAALTVDADTEAALSSWQGQLVATGSVVTARSRSLDGLRAKLAEVDRAQSAADARARDVEHLESRLAQSDSRADVRGRELLTAGSEYTAQVRTWAAGLSGVDASRLLSLVELPDTGGESGGLSGSGDPDGPVEDRAVEDRAVERDLPVAVRDAAHDLVEPILSALDSERDEILARERTCDEELTAAVREKEHWERQTDPMPPNPPYATAVRDTRTGSPFYLLVDFAESLDAAARSGLEAALQASGLLNAWVCGDGTILATDHSDVLLHPGEAVAGPSLADVLAAVPPGDCAVSEERVRRLLAHVGLGESTAPSWVATNGRWRLGVTHGAHAKPAAEYIGAGARAATRARRIGELADRIEQLGSERDLVRRHRVAVEQRRDVLRLAVRELPDGRALAAAWTAYDEAVAAVGRLTNDLAAARRTAEQARATAVGLREQVAARATADGLPTDPHVLADLRAELGRLGQSVDTVRRDAERVARRLERHRSTRTTWEATHAGRREAEEQYEARRTELVSARRELQVLEEAVGASEQTVLDREHAAQDRLRQAELALPQARTTHARAHDAVVRAEVRQQAALSALSEQEHQTVATGTQLRAPLGLPGLTLAAELGVRRRGNAVEQDAAVPTGDSADAKDAKDAKDADDGLDRLTDAFDSVQSGGVRERIAALRALADGVEGRLGTSGGDVGDAAILKRGEELRDGLAGGFDASVNEIDGIKRFELHDDVGAHDVAVVGRRIRAAADSARHRLSTREHEVFERYLLGELCDHLGRQVLAAQNLVAVMNETLDEVRSSHGIGARLVWQLPADASADVRVAVNLLRQPAALRAREASNELRGALRSLIEDARRTDPSAGYGTHLRTALDYRSWFSFTVRVTDRARPDRERVLSHRTALSQGEQRVVSYVVLFAAAAAHFTSIGRSTPTAPRLILLDDAFAKVDEPTHGNLLGLLVDLDLDFVCTSERLWGCFPTVPSLHVYECLRDPLRRGVATVHYTWDGHRKRLVGV